MGEGGGGAVQHILFTDIARSSYLWENFPGHYPAALEAHNQLTESCVERAGGEVMKNMGDGYIALFPDASSATQAAVDLQLQLSAEGPGRLIPAFPDGSELVVRAIVHGGELQRLGTGRGWFGTPLNRAARILGVCHPGQVLLSGITRRSLGEPPAEWTLDDLGPCRLRDMGEPEQLWQLTHSGFAKRQFPPLVTLDSRPNNLASQPNAFVGREQELRTLARMLAGDTRLLTLHAPGGYGKSRLASQLCANVLGRFEHGVFEVMLAPLSDHGRLPEAIASATGFQFFGSREPAQQILDYLRAKELLLCFDNFEHVLDGADFVAEILKAAPKVRIIATSREPLRLSAEKVFRLDPLPTGAGSDAVQLFADRALLVRHDFVLDESSSPWVEQICEKLEGIPLSIELFAAWADDFTLAEMYEQVGSQLEQTARMRDIPARQRSVRASCDWSWNLLSEQQRETLMRLAPFKGGFFLEAASAVLGQPEREVRTLLSGLSDKSWLFSRELEWKILEVTTRHSRYFVRDAASHEYVALRLAESTAMQESASSAHAALFAALAELEGPRLNGGGQPDGGRAQLTALKTWQIELENIYAALEAAAASSRVDLLLPVARWLGRYLDLTSSYLTSRERYTGLLAAAQRLGSPELELQAKLGLARAQWRLGRYDAAQAALEAFHSLAQALADSSAESSYFNELGSVFHYQGNYAAARESYTQALTLYCQQGNLLGEAICRNNLGLVENRQGHFAASREQYAQALDIFGRLGNRFGEATSLTNLGLVERKQGNAAAAEDHYRRALAMHRELGHRRGEADCQNSQGQALFHQGDLQGARQLYVQALARYRELGYRHGEANCLLNLGNLLFMEEALSDAAELYAQALTISREVGDRSVEGSSLNNMGVVQRRLANYSAAAECYAQALTIKRENANHASLAISCTGAGAVLASLGTWEGAARTLFGGRAAVAALAISLGPEDNQTLDAGMAALQDATTSGKIQPQELAQWQEEGERLSIEQLVEVALAALEDARSAALPLGS